MRIVHLREALLGCLALSLAVAGLAVDQWSGSDRNQGSGSDREQWSGSDREQRSRRPASAGVEVAASSGPPARFHERSVFCPGAVERERPEGTGRGAFRVLSVYTPRSKGIGVGARPWIEHPTPVDGKMLWLPGADRRAVNVVGSGGRVTAASLIGWPATHRRGRRDAAAPGGAGASGCSPVASDRWYFPLGASSAGWDERITILNPFPDAAVARVDFAAEPGAKAQDPHEVAVPARSSVQVEINRVALPDSSLAATVAVRRGRVVAWKTIFRSRSTVPGRSRSTVPGRSRSTIERSFHRLARLQGPSPETGPAAGGALFSLGATDTSGRWYFPEAGAGPGRSTTLALMNPAREPATVTVSLLGRGAIDQTRRLVDVAVPAGGSTFVPLKASAARRGFLRSFSAVVVSTGGAEVVAERSMSYGTAGLEGVASEIGAPRPGRRWSLAPAAANPSADDVIVLNPGPQDAVLDLTVFHPSRPGVAPPRLQGLVVEAGTRSTIAVGRHEDENRPGDVKVVDGERGPSPGFVLVRSSAPIVAERRAYSPDRGDVASIMGEPLPLGMD